MKNEKTVTGNGVVSEKSEILFLYESTYSIPNGDPFTGEQRYDEETKKALVSDVRIKRFVRDYLAELEYEIYVIGDKKLLSEDEGSGAERRFKWLQNKHKDVKEPIDVLLKCIDAKLFGGIVTIKTKKKKNQEITEDTAGATAFNLTGPVQFALLNPSLNEIDLRPHQNTSVFPSKESNKQGAMGTTTVVPYSINQIHGWINPYSAKHTGLTNADINLMFKALWESINGANTRTKSNQNSLLLLQIVYSQPDKKIYGVDRLIKINSGEKDKKGEQLRNIDDVSFNFSELDNIANKEEIKEIRYYTTIEKIEKEFEEKAKFLKMDMVNK